MDESENLSVNPRANTAKVMGDIVEARLTRRGFLKSTAALTALSFTPQAAAVFSAASNEFDFEEITRGQDETHHIPAGYKLDLVLKWGDPIFPDAPDFDIENLSAEAQERQFGYNCDFIGYYPLGDSNGLLCVNHEYFSSQLVFPGVASGRERTREECEIELAGHGGTIVEIERSQNGQWSPKLASPYNRRITANSTVMEITGPAAGSDRMKTADDPTGRRVLGTMNNCAGGMTPWGTYLMAEENFNGNFLGTLPDDHAEAANHARYGVPGGWYTWGKHFNRFDVAKAPNEPNRYGWVVEVDILDPTSVPKKRTALGRFKHEGAENIIAPDGRVVLYMGDDQRFDYVYKFVTANKYVPNDRAANMDLLDDGTLYAARFNEDGTLDWLPLVYGHGPLTPENGFGSQADVLIEARRAADLLGATPMDRPEDVEPHPTTGKIYVMLTNNHKRTDDQIDAANPRSRNLNGHIIEITEPGGDFTATKSTWDILVRCGDPNTPEQGATWNNLTSDEGWFGSPDNCAIDPRGRLWVATDGNHTTGASDGLWAMSTQGEARGTSRAFFRAPVGAEVCGPRFTDDGKTLFIAVQHPGDGRGASFENPTTRWPDFKPGIPPRPTVVAIERDDFGPIGG